MINFWYISYMVDVGLCVFVNKSFLAPKYFNSICLFFPNFFVNF